ncbi:hypothetical protein GO730_20910 [Spirosoma sp. HMF3257]|uniref:Uncharacterized protein n=1 Tax=Spirosoma telluris TaxID=2183553 RepID=A0A327NNN9_9BACT|nr:hypothetical protein [Spirosoma telluris]RAI76009.1 hypothetical protein HMF3257_20835 [Spirosoma telluris]
MTKIRKLGSNFYVLQSGKVGAVATFGDTDTSYAAKPTGGAGSRGDYVPWGEKNDQLALMHQLASESPNKWSLVKVRRNFVAGRGIYTHADEKAGQGSDTLFVPKKFPSFEAWRLLADYDRVWIRKNFQYAFCGNAFVKFTFGTDKKVANMEAIDPFKIRPRKLKAGKRGYLPLSSMATWALSTINGWMTSPSRPLIQPTQPSIPFVSFI